MTSTEPQPGSQTHAYVADIAFITPREREWHPLQRPDVYFRKFLTILQQLCHLYALRRDRAIELMQPPHMVTIPTSQRGQVDGRCITCDSCDSCIACMGIKYIGEFASIALETRPLKQIQFWNFVFNLSKNTEDTVSRGHFQHVFKE